jgi:magnesium transporter
MTNRHRHVPDSAFQHLVARVPRGRPHDTAGLVRHALSERHLEHIGTVYVLNGEDRLVGAVPLARLFAAAPETVLSSLMISDPPAVGPALDQERVAAIARRHRLAEVPVVDTSGAFLGVVPPQALLDVLRREHVEDMHKLAGIMHKANDVRQAIELPPLRRVRDRLPWLVVGLAGSILAAGVVAQFERALAAYVAIAFFMPMIVYLADAIGTQTEAVAVRALSLSQVPLGPMLAGELRTGVLIGAALGVLALPAAYLGTGDPRLALAVALAIVVAGTIATTIGLLLPWMLSRAGWDPAYGSGPVATVIQDVLSLVVYLALAAAII